MRPTASCSRATRGRATAFQIAVFGINGPISASPHNYIWMRTATLDFYPRERADVGRPAAFELERLAPGLDEVAGDGARVEQVAGGFEFTEGPVWSPEGALLFSSPNTNAIYRWDPRGEVTVFRSKSGYTGTDIGRYHQPGSNGLTFDPDGRLVMCQHGNRRVLRVEPHGNVDGDGRPLPGTAPELAQRPRLPLRRHARSSPTRLSGCPGSSTTRPRSCRSPASSPSATAR